MRVQIHIKTTKNIFFIAHSQKSRRSARGVCFLGLPAANLSRKRHRFACRREAASRAERVTLSGRLTHWRTCRVSVTGSHATARRHHERSELFCRVGYPLASLLDSDADRMMHTANCIVGVPMDIRTRCSARQTKNAIVNALMYGMIIQTPSGSTGRLLFRIQSYDGAHRLSCGIRLSESAQKKAPVFIKNFQGKCVFQTASLKFLLFTINAIDFFRFADYNRLCQFPREVFYESHHP